MLWNLILHAYRQFNYSLMYCVKGKPKPQTKAKCLTIILHYDIEIRMTFSLGQIINNFAPASLENLKSRF